MATNAPNHWFPISLSKSTSCKSSPINPPICPAGHRWVESIGLEPAFYGTHSMRRTKAAQIYRKTGNLRAVQLLLGHTKLESTVRYLGIEVDDALNMAEQIEL
jgi:integrase